jgi:hypothetical protein
MKAPQKPAKSAPPTIPLSDGELQLMQPYLARANSAMQAFRSAQESLDGLAKVIAGRAGAPDGQRFKLDIQGKRLIPIS